MNSIKDIMQKAMKDAGTKELGDFSNKGLDSGEDISNMLTSITKMQREVSEEEYDEFFEELEGEEKKEEAKEATGAGSAGGYEAPLFSEPKKNNLFQPDTETKLTTQPEGGPVNEDEIPGGLSDGMTLKDLAKHQNTDIETLISQMEKGVNVEMEHTSDISIATEIAMDHIYEDLHYYDKLEDMESKPHKEESKEATTASSSGPYDAPFGGPKKDPLKLSNPDTVEKELRSVKDKNFPKYGGPGGKFVKIKDMNKEIENMIDGIVDKVLSEEVAKKAEQITESVSEEIDEMAEFYEIAKKRKEERMESKTVKPDFPDIDGDGDTEEPISKAAEDKKKSETDEEMEEGNAFSGALDKAREEGKDKFEVDGETYDVEPKESVQLSEEEMIDLIEKIIEEQKISGGGKIAGVTSQNKAMKTSEKETNEYHKDLMKKFKDYLKDGSKGKFETEPKTFPKGNGELEKMEKKAYTPSDSVEEYIDQIARSGGMENLDYDQIKPDEEWLDKNIVGSSETGNSDEYANAVATDVNKNVKKRKDLDVLNKLKKQSYEKAPQPVFDMAGENTHKDVMDLGESKEDKKQTKINEDLDRMKNLISHNYKSQ